MRKSLNFGLIFEKILRLKELLINERDDRISNLFLET
jgi:hypothetical protein